MEKEEKLLRSYFTAQCLLNILKKKTAYFTMVRLALGYVSTIFLVQFMRYLKRLYVRKFANRIILTLRSQLYYALLTGQKQTDIGDVITKTLSDADDCTEGELNKATLDRMQNALTYWIFGVEDSQNRHYER